MHYPVTSGYAQEMHLLRGIPFVSTLHLTSIPSSGYRGFLSFWDERVILSSTSQDQRLERAIAFGLAHQNARSDWINVDNQGGARADD